MRSTTVVSGLSVGLNVQKALGPNARSTAPVVGIGNDFSLDEEKTTFMSPPSNFHLAPFLSSTASGCFYSASMSL